MSFESITIPLDPEAARAYASVGNDDRKKIQLLLSLRLRELASLPSTPLQNVMNDMAAKAEERGLSSEILEGFLRDK